MNLTRTEFVADCQHHKSAYFSLKQKKPGLKKKRRKRSSKTLKKSPYRYVWFDTYNKRWRGLVVRGKLRVYASNRNSDKITAQILNSRCRDNNIEPPNPSIGFFDQPQRKKTKKKPQSLETCTHSEITVIDLLPRPATELILFLPCPASLQ